MPLRMSVDVISFSAHADFKQTSGFVEALDPAHVVLVHGEAVEMGRLRKELEKQAEAAGRPRALYTPKVGQPVHITHASQHTIRVGPCSASFTRELTALSVCSCSAFRKTDSSKRYEILLE